MDATTITLDQFIEQYGLSMTARDMGPAGKGWTAEHHRYACTIRGAGALAPLHVNFHTNPRGKMNLPKLADVLNCLASNAASVENARNFVGWCSEFGADPDSREQERIYRACHKEARQLRELLGTQAYEVLLWSTERL